MTDAKPTTEIRTLILSAREPGRYFDVYKAEQGVNDVFADGYFGIWGDAAVTRIGLYINEEPKIEDAQVIEQRILKTRLILPSRTLIQMCINVLQRAATAPEEYNWQDLFRDTGVVVEDDDGSN